MPPKEHITVEEAMDRIEVISGSIRKVLSMNEDLKDELKKIMGPREETKPGVEPVSQEPVPNDDVDESMTTEEEPKQDVPAEQEVFAAVQADGIVGEGEMTNDE